ncbi:hypothetical protein RIF29_29787 [Crotalaria pallida]|uniref:Uncharacterized protein n=1 Tax=Crotalaria pallida TaxID=3830 RepID=A0AAN9HXR8_CROPI
MMADPYGCGLDIRLVIFSVVQPAWVKVHVRPVCFRLGLDGLEEIRHLSVWNAYFLYLAMFSCLHKMLTYVHWIDIATHQSPPPPPHHSLAVVAEPEPELELEPEAPSNLSPNKSETSDSSDSSLAPVSPLAVAPQASLDLDSSFDLSDSDDNESTSSSEEDEQEAVQQAVKEDVLEP